MIDVYSKEWKHFLHSILSEDNIKDYRYYVHAAIIESIENIFNCKNVEIGQMHKSRLFRR